MSNEQVELSHGTEVKDVKGKSGKLHAPQH